jgi:amidohydrolase
MSIEKHIPEAVALAAQIRHRLHQHPELAYQEVQTASVIREELTRLGIEFVAGVVGAPTATLATIGDLSKPCIALRADIDALPITEQTGLPYASKRPGFMHACGHDGHTANLIASASVLKKIVNDLDVCVKLVFQPAEEGGAGASRLVAAGALDGRIGPRVKAIYGLHGWPGLPVGTVSTKPGPLLAATDTFKATFTGKGCHGAFPHLGRDPIVCAAESVLNLQMYVSRELDPTEPALITVGMIHAGTATNVIPDQAVIQGTIRTLTPQTRGAAAASLQRRCEGIAMANGCSVAIELSDGYPPTVNDPEATEFVVQTAKKSLGAARLLPAARPVMGGEDFAYYAEQIPACFFMIGMIPVGQSVYPPLHSDRYDFNDAAFETGIRMFVELAIGSN